MFKRFHGLDFAHEPVLLIAVENTFVKHFNGNLYETKRVNFKPPESFFFM